MDIKFVGSSVSAKAILYYITDYITKSQLKTHVAYAALELAVSKLGEYDPTDDDIIFCGKCLLQRCAYAMISHQELSAPQVISYLMGYDDHFTSHKFTCFHWRTAESFIDKQLPLSSHVIPDTVDSAEGNHDTNVIGDHNINVCPVASEKIMEAGHSTNNTNDGLLPFSDTDAAGKFATDSTTDNDVRAVIDGDEDVFLHVDSNNNIVTHSSWLDNYLFHGGGMADICFWDYVSCVEKVSRAVDHKVIKNIIWKCFFG